MSIDVDRKDKYQLLRRSFSRKESKRDQEDI